MYSLGQKYHAPQVQPGRGLNSWPPNHDSTFHVTETPGITTRPSVTATLTCWYVIKLTYSWSLVSCVSAYTAYCISFVLRCRIQRYSVIPLSTNSGLIGWVPHCDTLHSLIRDYREKKKILLNIEHRIMLRVRAVCLNNIIVFDKVKYVHNMSMYYHGVRKVSLYKKSHYPPCNHLASPF